MKEPGSYSVYDAISTALGLALGVALTLGYERTFPDNSPRLPAAQQTAVTMLPPAHFTGGGQAIVRFVPAYMIADFCGDNAVACADAVNGTTITIINPCTFSSAHPIINYRQRGPGVVHDTIYPSRFSTTLCHELGHINGWDHGNGPITAAYPEQPAARR